MHRRVHWALAWGLFAWTGPAWAQQPTAPSPDLGAEAELHFDIGVRHYAAGDYEAALEHLLLSNRLAANRKVVFNIARAYEARGNPTAAWSHYADFVAAEPDSELRAPALQAMERLAAEVALVEVTSDPPGAAIYVDRRDLGQRGTTPRTLALAEGKHVVILDSPGHVSTQAPFEVVAGSTESVELSLEPELVDVMVDGVPSGAEVRRKDTRELLGFVPVDLQIPAGEVVLEIRAVGHAPREIPLSLVAGRPERIQADLEPVLGALEIEGPTGARIEIDGIASGTVPARLQVEVGPHIVRIDAEGYREARYQVNVAEGDVAELDARLLPRTDIVGASRVEESLLDAPSTVVVVDREDIRQRGYTDLAEVLPDLPGFDAIVANGVTYMLAYQRGYRTPQTQRTLLLTDGLEDSLMWSQSAEISRQFPFTDIERIEVLYGPASAVYGPNAFAGVINVVTVDPRDLSAGEHEGTVQVSGGSFGTGIVDGSARGRIGSLGYAISGRFFASQEPDFTGAWGFVDADQLSDADVWGPLVDPADRGPFRFGGNPLGTYADPSEDWGVRGRLFLGNLELGASQWVVSEGYGPYYAADRAQPAPIWSTRVRRIWGQFSAELSDRFESRTLLQHKSDRIFGDWAEASPLESNDRLSEVSLTQWNAPSERWEARQQLIGRVGTSSQLMLGGRWRRNDMTREYDAPGYWDSFSSVAVQPGSAQVPSTQTTYELPPSPARDMPAVNRVTTDDLGGFGQLISDLGAFRLNLGARADWNSVYGLEISPRATAIYRFADEKGALKLFYGHAVQEPSARQLWGEWDGRGVNPDLLPEHVDNLELIAMLRTPTALVEGSVFGAHYRDVIKEEAENAGNRSVGGFEARASAALPNPAPAVRPVDVYANYTFTATRGSESWKPIEDDWVERASPIGDIAPHKANAGLTWPLWGWAALHGRSNLVSARLPYSRNPLRGTGYRFPAYGLFDAMASVHAEGWDLGLQVDNVFDARILQPGAESANAGFDFENRSLGYHNSALPLPGRAVLLTLTVDGSTAR